jgi:hypothetical protein
VPSPCPLPHTHLSTLRQRACVMASPVLPGEVGRERTSHTYTHVHTIPSGSRFPCHPFWTNGTLPDLWSCRTRDQREGPTCRYARKVFAEPATMSRLKREPSLPTLRHPKVVCTSLSVYLASCLIWLSSRPEKLETSGPPPITLTQRESCA